MENFHTGTGPGKHNCVPIVFNLCFSGDLLGREAGVLSTADHGLKEGGGAVDVDALVPVDAVALAVFRAVVVAGDRIADVINQAAQLGVAELIDQALHGRIVGGGKLEAEIAADLVAVAGDIGKGNGILQGRLEDVVQEGQLFLAVVVAAHIAGRGVSLDGIQLGLHLFHTLDLGLNGGQFDPDGLGLGVGLIDALADHLVDKLVIRQANQHQSQDCKDDLFGAGKITAQDFHGLLTSSGALR